MSGSEILIAGDSNLRRVVELNKDPQIDVLCVGGAKIVGDRKGFWDKLLEALKLTEATTLVLHMGSNDVHTMSTSPTTFVREYKLALNRVRRLFPHIAICLMEILPRNYSIKQEVLLDQLTSRILDMNGYLAGLAYTTPGCISKSYDLDAQRHLDRDGLHVNLVGARRMLDVHKIVKEEVEYPSCHYDQVDADFVNTQHIDTSMDSTKPTYAEIVKIPTVQPAASKGNHGTPNKTHKTKNVREQHMVQKRGVRAAHMRKVTRFRKCGKRLYKKVCSDSWQIEVADVAVAISAHSTIYRPTRNTTVQTKPKRNQTLQQKYIKKTTKPRVWYDCPECPRKCSGEMFLLDHIIRRHRNSSTVATGHTHSREQHIHVPTTSTQALDSKEAPLEETREKCTVNSATGCSPNVRFDYTWEDSARVTLLLSGDIEEHPGPNMENTRPKTYNCQWDQCHENFESINQLGIHMELHVRPESSCLWNECMIPHVNLSELMSHVLQHIYQDSYTFDNIEEWKKALPYELFDDHTDLRLCPPQLRHHLELESFDENYEIPSDLQPYTVLQHKQLIVEKYFEELDKINELLSDRFETCSDAVKVFVDHCEALEKAELICGKEDNIADFEEAAIKMATTP